MLKIQQDRCLHIYTMLKMHCKTNGSKYVSMLLDWGVSKVMNDAIEAPWFIIGLRRSEVIRKKLNAR